VASGIDIEDVAVGVGPMAERGQFVSIRWRGTLNRGDSFGEGEVSFRAGGDRDAGRRGSEAAGQPTSGLPRSGGAGRAAQRGAGI
jgi:hypothetical protein